MTRHELAYVLIRLTALSLGIQAIRMLPWSIVLEEQAGGGTRSVHTGQFVDFVVAMGLAVVLCVTSKKLSKLVASD